MFDLFKRPAQKYHVNPKFRAYGKARLDIAQRAATSSDWEQLWKKPAHNFPFSWGEPWKQCIEYRVDDFAAEVGFWIDVLGLPVNAFDPDYAMFTSPGRDFNFAVVPAPPGSQSTPPDAIRIQFMLEDVLAAANTLEGRGVVFEQWPQPCAPGSSLNIGYFRTPHGICVDLWGEVEKESLEDTALAQVATGVDDRPAEDELIDESESDEVEDLPVSELQPELNLEVAEQPGHPPLPDQVDEEIETSADEPEGEDDEDFEYVYEDLP
jgi:catechol 2,3-dioxygenase-like lactoylglutathione lyase family enzyme